jgi:FAD/FMN-containing dehydrogenase
VEALARSLAEAHAGRRPVATIDLGALAALREHTPEDMTVTVEGGMNLAELQARLATRGQWLPIDPPHPDRVTIRQLLADNLSGPRRCGFGTIREHLIGLEAVLADGRVVHSGGKVVKNVAGYDLLKLFVGARDSLGIITAATFKLRPLPTVEAFASVSFDTLVEALALVEAVLASALTPVALDLDNLQLVPGQPLRFTVFMAFAGSAEEVAWQRAEAVKLGFPAARSSAATTEPSVPPLSALPRDSAFWSINPIPVSHGSVLPSNLATALAPLGQTPFIARAANGVFYHRSPPLPRSAAAPPALARRLKDTFDPHHILPELTL